MDFIKENWELIKETIRTEYDLSEISYKTWIKPLSFHSENDDVVTIMIPSDQAHSLKYISSKYRSFFQVTISEMMDHTYDISFILEKDAENDLNVYNINYQKANLISKYRFDTFVVGGNNKFAHSASLAVAESPGEVYNPLYLYGGAGLGKTHLMHSVGHFILDQDPDMKVLYVTSEQFTNEVIESIRSGNASRMNRLREKYRTVDVLLIDTAGRLHNKKNLMEELRKMNRIIDREFPDAHRENLIVLDGTTGQNALVQAREFGEVADLTGIILTKMDGTAKGGIAVAIQSELKVPVKYIGVGETIDDLQKFDSDEFVNALFDVRTDNSER